MPGANAAGPALREAASLFQTGTVRPLARLLQGEVSRVLERDVSIAFDTSTPAEIAQRARAVHILTQSGMQADEAKRIAGLA